jgi:hypothetical protein
MRRAVHPVLLLSILLAARAGGEEAASGSAGVKSRVPEEGARLAGTYVYVGGEPERSGMKAAVDLATEGMFGKVIARDELRKRSEPRPSYTIRFEADGKVSVETPGFPSESAPADGTEVVVRNRYGDVIRQSQQFVDGVLVQSGRNDDGSGTTEFRLTPDGNTLQVTRISRSPRLPRPLVYRLTYVRQPSLP